MFARVTRPTPQAAASTQVGGDPPRPAAAAAPSPLPPRVPASTYPAIPGRLAERAAPASCDCPSRCQEPEGSQARSRAEPGRAGAQRERPPHARPSPSPSPSRCPATAAAPTGTLTLPRSRGSRLPGSGPLFLVCSAQHGASESKSRLPHLSFSLQRLLLPFLGRRASVFSWGTRSE